MRLTNAEAFRFDFGISATKLWCMSEEEFLEWLNSEWSCCDREPPDAVPVVRCKDCKHSRKDDIFHTRWCQKPGHGKEVKDEFFCAYGERRTNE